MVELIAMAIALVSRELDLKEIPSSPSLRLGLPPEVIALYNSNQPFL